MLDRPDVNGREERPFPADELITLKLYHGSDEIRRVQDIKFPGPRENCDFGKGFYLAVNKHTAEEWVIREDTPIVNSYVFVAKKKDILYLSGEDWIRVLVGYRKKAYKVVLKSPIVCGTIADDRMDIALAAFMDETLGDKRLFEALNYCKLGEQYLLRTSSEYLSSHEFHELRGQELQRAFDRWSLRRKDMNDFVRVLFRKPVDGEKYVSDYIAGGDYIEV